MSNIVIRSLKTKLKVNLGKQETLRDISLPACDIHNEDHNETDLSEIEKLIRKKFIKLIYEECLIRRRIYKESSIGRKLNKQQVKNS